MGAIPKHEAGKPKQKQRKNGPVSVPEQPVRVEIAGPERTYGGSSLQHDINHVSGLSDVATNLDWIGDAVARLTHDDHSVGVSIGQNRYSGPVQLTLTDEDGNGMADRLVTAFERIADAVSKLAGLNRPRLESWHEQDEYEPRYKDIAVDGGAPGPKAP